MDHIEFSDRFEPDVHPTQHLVEIAGIDILVDDDRPFAGVSAALAGGRNVQRLARMTRIALANLDRGEARRRAGFVVPYAEHLGHAARLERPPDLRGTGNALEQPGLI